MAESCPGTTRASLENIQTWYIRDETYSAALAELVNAQKSRPLAALWGDGPPHPLTARILGLAVMGAMPVRLI